MAYQELIKNFAGIRDYMREFVVYGFRSRDEFTGKSGRTYDDSRRRIESWLGEHIHVQRTPDGKTVALSIDTRITGQDPLYKAWKSASFTDRDITLHFLLLDVLKEAAAPLSLPEILASLDERQAGFTSPLLFDESTVRKKLREYTSLGLLLSEKDGRKLCWRMADSPDLSCWQDALDFFAEAAPCGVIGSYLTDRLSSHTPVFTFKHHYIAHTLDSEILLRLLEAISARQEVTVCCLSPHARRKEPLDIRIVPLRIFVSAQSGRQYCMAYNRQLRRIHSYRMDYILDVTPGETAEDFGYLREKLDAMQTRMWGVSPAADDNPGGRTAETVTFTVEFSEKEEYIFTRLDREKRCGTVERLDRTHARFYAQVYDSNELVPWIRTFICRITKIYFSNPAVDSRFRSDIEAMYRLYGLEDDDALS